MMTAIETFLDGQTLVIHHIQQQVQTPEIDRARKAACEMEKAAWSGNGISPGIFHYGVTIFHCGGVGVGEWKFKYRSMIAAAQASGAQAEMDWAG